MPKRFTVDHILCPTDCTHYSWAAMQRAVNLARRFGARVTALHVMPELPPPLGGTTFARARKLSARKVAERTTRCEALDNFVAPFLDQGVPIETRAVRSEADMPWREIRAVAGALPADLIVMGTHGRAGVERFVLGSVAEKVLREAPCPVMIVGGPDDYTDATPLFAHILCATDLSPASAGTMATAVAFAEADANAARLTLLHVIRDEHEGSVTDPYRPVPEPQELRRAVEKAAETDLKRLAATATGFADVDWQVRRGKPWEETIHCAEEAGADLIVVGIHPHGWLGRWFLGSTTNEVVRHAPCPVLVAREDRDELAGAVSLAAAARVG
jgi:nucleotide-binding universal stress UspA family protein